MNGLIERLRKNPKTLVSALLPAVLLIILVVATGGGDIFGGGSSAPSTGPGNSNPPTTSTSAAVHGQVSVSARHLGGSHWQFTYTIHDVGETPIGGFQINGPRANLYSVSNRPGWAVFGAGVCAGKFPNMLVYWSTGPGSPGEVKPKDTVTFTFDVNTTGTIKRLYSLSWGQAPAQFAQIVGPARSSIPPSGPCKR